MRYLPHTEHEIRAMLERIGVSDIDGLFEAIPKEGRLGRALDLEPTLSEPELMRALSQLSNKNEAASMLSFMGAGSYDHHVPPAVDQLLLRSEFYTAYTPYQAEVSQGTLQATFEFQTLVCQILKMEVANASMYDGASSLAEAVQMARRVTGRHRVVISRGLHPEYIETVEAYLRGTDDGTPDVTWLALDANGQTSRDNLEKALGNDVAALVVGYPNYVGCVEPMDVFRKAATNHGALLVTSSLNPYAFSLLKAPGEWGVDIATGEGQALAVPPQYGGPGVGLFACRKEFVRQMPGRLVGQTLDGEGKRGFVLTLSTREQHIRRERATSNICTNHGLVALSFAMRVAMLGALGYRHVGELCLANAEYLKGRIAKIQGLSLPYRDTPTFNEFVVRSAHSAEGVLAAARKKGVLAGVAVRDSSSDFLVATTEKHTKADLDRLLEALAT